MDPADLYQEEIFTDRKVGSIRRLTPVDTDGGTDSRRPVLFVGQAQLLTAMGPVPLTFEIPADTLKQAIDRFPDAAQKAVAAANKSEVAQWPRLHAGGRQDSAEVAGQGDGPSKIDAGRIGFAQGIRKKYDAGERSPQA